MNIQTVMKNWIQTHGPYMYHSAKPQLASAICKVGLLPARALGHSGNYNEDLGLTHLQSRLDNVYLSAHPKKLYSGQAGKLVQPYLEIDIRNLDPNGWCIDEDHKGYMQTNNLEPWSMEKETKGEWATRHAQQLDTAENIAISLQQGSISYHGAIPAQNTSFNPQLEHVHQYMSNIEHLDEQMAQCVQAQDQNTWHELHAQKSYLTRIIGTPAIISGDIQKHFMVNDHMRQAALEQELANWKEHDIEGKMQTYLQRKYDLEDTSNSSIKAELDRYTTTGQWHIQPNQSLESYTKTYTAPIMPSLEQLSL